MTARADDVTSRRPRLSTIIDLRPPLADRRFWLIQVLVVAIVALHAALEWAESRDRLIGFLDGVQDFPVPANIIPVVLAGVWFGMRGGVLTGLTTMVLSAPNLILFHMDAYAWLGEALTNLLVVGVGLVIGAVVEHNTDLRRQAEANEARLRTLWDVAAVLSVQDDEVDVITHVVEQLAATSGIAAVAFVPVSWEQGDPLIVAGGAVAVSELRRSLPLEATGAGAAIHDPTTPGGFDVATSTRHFGTLVVDCIAPTHCAEDRLLYSLIANELASALETLDHRDAEKRHLRGYARAVTAAQEQERRRIARDLHDGPTQSMIVINRALSRLDAAGPRSDVVAELRELVHDTLGAIQRTTQALRPLLLDDLGLVPAIRSLAERRAHQSNLIISVDAVGEPQRIDAEAEVAAYRIAQEALTNVERHAHADHAEIRIEFTESDFLMAIQDDGVGFAPDGELVGEQFGIVGMRERAALVGGELMIDAREGAGTTIRFLLPLGAGRAPGGLMVTTPHWEPEA